MNDAFLKLSNAPIIEAVIDIDCDMPPTFDLPALENSISERFSAQYPTLRRNFIQEHQIKPQSSTPPAVIQLQPRLQAFQMLQKDERQLVQIRTQGFSFNRLKPYSCLDDYLPEIHRTWKLFVELTSPVLVRFIHLRYINRILLPLQNENVELNDYLKISPQLPDEEKLSFTGFLNQHAALEKDTGNLLNIILIAQQSENKTLPIIFHIETKHESNIDPNDWDRIRITIDSLRSLKNRVFKNTLTDKCLQLFQN